MAKVTEAELPEVWLIELEPLGDARGRFMETYRASWLPHAAPMVQGNRSESAPGVLRGLHYHRRQADLWFVQSGHVTTVLLDARVGSPTEGRHVLLEQGDDAPLAVYIPEGVAHGFYAHDAAVMSYLVSNEYDGSDELGIAWDDPGLGIAWPAQDPILSDRDRRNPRLRDVPGEERVRYERTRGTSREYLKGRHALP